MPSPDRDSDSPRISRRCSMGRSLFDGPVSACNHEFGQLTRDLELQFVGYTARRYWLGHFLLWSERDQDRANQGEHRYSNQFSAGDQMAVRLDAHYGGMGKAGPRSKGDQATVRGRVSGCDQQEKAECNVKAQHHG